MLSKSLVLSHEPVDLSTTKSIVSSHEPVNCNMLVSLKTASETISDMIEEWKNIVTSYLQELYVIHNLAETTYNNAPIQFQRNVEVLHKFNTIVDTIKRNIDEQKTKQDNINHVKTLRTKLDNIIKEDGMNNKNLQKKIDIVTEISRIQKSFESSFDRLEASDNFKKEMLELRTQILSMSGEILQMRISLITNEITTSTE